MVRLLQGLRRLLLAVEPWGGSRLQSPAAFCLFWLRAHHVSSRHKCRVILPLLYYHQIKSLHRSEECATSSSDEVCFSTDFKLPHSGDLFIQMSNSQKWDLIILEDPRTSWQASMFLLLSARMSVADRDRRIVRHARGSLQTTRSKRKKGKCPRSKVSRDGDGILLVPHTTRLPGLAKLFFGWQEVFHEVRVPT